MAASHPAPDQTPPCTALSIPQMQTQNTIQNDLKHLIDFHKGRLFSNDLANAEVEP